jgi:hypothetical protein
MSEFLKPPEYYAEQMSVSIYYGEAQKDVYDAYRKGGSVSWSFNSNTWDISLFVHHFHTAVDKDAITNGMIGYLRDFTVFEVKNKGENLPPVESVRIAILKFLNPV